ncbi:MAG: biotin/lipoyl-containing protein [Steroidobacteraceae bacterium]
MEASGEPDGCGRGGDHAPAGGLALRRARSRSRRHEDQPQAQRRRRRGARRHARGARGAGRRRCPGGRRAGGRRGRARGAPAGAADPSTSEVSSPLLGTFYRAPKPGAPPFVDVGSLVEPDTVIAIVEVMKLMNTVRAGVHGTVSEILARDGELVEYGQALLRVRRAS